MVPSTSILWAVPFISLAIEVTAQNCKATSGSTKWPSTAEWENLDSALGRRLIKVSPPGAVCHPERTEYDSEACETISGSWNTSRLHSDNPFSSMWGQYTNNSCVPDVALPCSDDGFPAFAVNATTTQHVKLAVDFAREHNVRLIVKNTGHDYLGRSSGAGSLAIWTHHMTSMAFEDGPFQAKGCPSCSQTTTTRAVLGAGCQFGSIYAFLDQYNHTIVGGASMTVGLGGYLTGGGHGLLAPDHGLGADQIVEVEMVTPQGNIVILNECQNQDLFWAIRGGGGSTYGVITRFTLKTYPSPRITSAVFSLSASPNSTVALGLGPLVMSRLPGMVEAGMRGYLWSPSHGRDFNRPDVDMGGIYGSLSIPNLNSTAVFDRLWNPIVAEAQKRWGADRVHFAIRTKTYPSYFAYIQSNFDRDPVGLNKYVDTWMLGADTLRSESAEVYEANRCAASRGFQQGLRVLLVNGKGVHEAQPSGGTISVHPAWRRSYAVFAMEQYFQPLDEVSRLHAVETVNNCMTPLKKLEPESGGYLNEAIRHQTNWQSTFWGENYRRLLEIKKKIDPENVFWCEACVGSEGWEEVDGGLCQV